LLLSIQVFPQTKERKDIPEKYKWNLSDIYSSNAEWQIAAGKIKTDINKIAAFKGRLVESASVLKEALQNYFTTLKELYTLSTYSNRLSDENMGITENQELNQVANNIGTEFSEKTAFIRPELLKIDPQQIQQFLTEEKGLAEYKMFIEDIQRMREHTLTGPEEEILASFGLVTGTPSDVFNIFTNDEMPFPKVTISTGETVELTNSTFGRYRPSEVREDRAKVFETFFNNYGQFENTLGLNLAGKVKTDFVYAKLRGYKTALEASVDGPNVPVTVYENLITQVNKSLPTLHRFLNMKKKMLGVDTLHYYDLYTPIVKKVDMSFTVEEGQKVIHEALKPLGEEYVNTLTTAFNNRWIDYLPSVGKRSGAYSTGGAYDVHPYILMNWNDDFESVSTLAHELGHTMHSYFSNKTQPFPTSDYATFVAEIASTFNENLLNNYMVENAKSDEEKLYILGSYLELLRTTIFRQTLFAEFEWEIHKLAENNQPISGKSLSNIYYNLVKKYYGDAEGVCRVDPYIAYEWSYILHFLNYTYYVYQYSTSLIYATALAEKVVAEGQPAVDKYYSILKGGGSEYPIELIKKAGVDPLSSEAFELTMKKMNKVMDQMEEILGKM
ncbi:MAG: oligoendopeptidase F, partial [Ignavibacteriaceae bacterium]